MFFLPDSWEVIKTTVIPKHIKHGTRPYRDLEKWEKEYLRDYINLNDFRIGKRWFIQGIAMGIIIVIPLAIWLAMNTNMDGDSFEGLIKGGVLLVIIIGAVWQAYMTTRMNIKRDLDSPVHIEVKKFNSEEKDISKRDQFMKYKVGKMVVSLFRTNPQYHNIVKNIPDGAVVAVEYSPRSKFIWDIHPLTENGAKKYGELQACFVYCQKNAIGYRYRTLSDQEKATLLSKRKWEENIWDSQNPVYKFKGEATISQYRGKYTLHIAEVDISTKNVINKEQRKALESRRNEILDIDFSPFTYTIWRVGVFE